MYKLICHIFSFLWSSAVHALQPKIKDYYTKSVLRQQRLWKSKAAQLLSQEWFYLRASQCFKLLQQDVLSQSHISFQLVILPPRPLQFLVWKRSTLWMTMVRLKFLWCSWRKGASESSMRVCSVCVNMLYDSQLWLWKSLCRCWEGHSAVSLSAGWHSAWQQGYQSPSLSPGWLTTVLSPGCAKGTHNISNTHTAWCIFVTVTFKNS